jgi:hypothetical protein
VKKPILLVYVAGPYRTNSEFGSTAFGREANIFHAREAGARLAKAGHMPIIPHANTAQFDGLNTDEFFLDATLELMLRCDAVFLMPNWQDSTGARAEKEEAEQLGLPVYTSIAELDAHRARMASDLERLANGLNALDLVLEKSLGNVLRVKSHDEN